MKAIQFAFMTFKNLENKSILLKSDNTTCVAYLNHQGEMVSPEISAIAELIWELCLKKNIKLKAQYLPGRDNILADYASCIKFNRNDWILNPKIFSRLNTLWDPFTVDMFANRLNAQLLMYFS